MSRILSSRDKVWTADKKLVQDMVTSEALPARPGTEHIICSATDLIYVSSLWLNFFLAHICTLEIGQSLKKGQAPITWKAPSRVLLQNL